MMNKFDEAKRTWDPRRYDREFNQGICGFNKSRDRCTVACRALKNIDRNSVEKMEEKVKKETRRFSTNALKKLKEKKHKEMTIEQEATKQKMPPEAEKHQEQEEEEDNPKDAE